jgi:hypothetical protein
MQNAECSQSEAVHTGTALQHSWVPNAVCSAEPLEGCQLSNWVLLWLVLLICSLAVMPVKAKKRKPRTSGALYAKKPGPKGPQAAKDAPKKSAQPAKSTKWKNLTLHDWINTVFPCVDQNKNLAHTAIAKHFTKLPDGALKFNATTLGQELNMHQELKAHALSFPGAHSSKRPQIVT